jgi:hypothetical protein
MINSYLPYISLIQSELTDISSRNNKKLEEIIEKYKETKNLPRKRKKRIRKELNQEYSFWYSIGEWEKEMLGVL